MSETYLDMMGRTLAQGRGLTYVDITDNKKVCVVGDYIARAAYGGNAIGQTIKIGSAEIYHRGRAGSQCQQYDRSGGHRRLT